MKTSRRILSLLLCLVMLCGVMSITVSATSADPTVVVYATEGMFTAGGYSPDHGFIDQTLVNLDPSQHLIDPSFFTGYDEDSGSSWYDQTSIVAGLAECQAVYAPNGYSSSTVTVLDAIIYAMQFNGYACTGGWDSNTSPNGGYVHSAISESANYSGTVTIQENALTVDGVNYDQYTGYGWRIAVKYPDGSFEPLEHYGTNYPIVDGMEIIFDYSPYVMFDVHNEG